MTWLLPQRSKAHGCALAVGIGVLTIVVANGSFSLITEKPLNLREEWGPFLAQMLMVAAPFGLLAMAGVKDRTS